MQLFSDNDKRKYLHILGVLKYTRVTLFTQSELAELLEVSRKTLIDFEKGKRVDFELLTQYAAILGRSVSFKLD